MNPNHPTPPTLIGTVHRDPRGRQKLLRLLEELRPGALTLEMSRTALNYRQIHGGHLSRRLERILQRLAGELDRPAEQLAAHPAIADIRKLLAPPFEYQAAAAYAEQFAVPLELIDSAEISAVKLKRVEVELITYANLKVLVGLPAGAEKTEADGFAMARQLVPGSLDPAVRQAFLEKHRGEEGIGARDRAMAERIRRYLTAWPERNLVHVGGWLHLVEDRRAETLYSLLADLEPRRILLDDQLAEGLYGTP